MGQIRIIGGQWKRTPIPVRDAQGLRPTPDRVRETLFNWLGQRLDGWRCLDLFAGSGALGFEAASRGAAQVVFVEPDPAACKAIEQLIEKLKAQQQLQLVHGQAQAWLEKNTQAFDLIFMDPPFGRGLIEKALPLALAVLGPQGLLYLESDSPYSAQWAHSHGLELLRQDKAGMVHYHLLQIGEGRTQC